ncbi:hypothetical protein GN244_ATG15313 [Phytophthora infestans]|uniref:BZIP domain-containing protein n=1 Tax=Phytophthora infestans TaxID=4787 RepID=A0A833SME2_PHYIN|nr:hypothetical protein GN244_ATG15313 [Phytophthora infestans]KAF4146185.1 hypothetical protein GN958_ATG04660 [Phytophthora infestans]KAI9990773.1 hypothetical protein PInf_018338 [Phytophthora infestans]
MFMQSENAASVNFAWEDLDAAVLLADAESLLMYIGDKSSGELASSDNIKHLTSSSDNAEVGKRKIRRAADARKRQVYRRVRKSERQELRRQFSILSEELSRLRQTKEDEKTAFDAAQTSGFWFWQANAIQQRQERLLAEDEQRALTVTAQVQATYIRKLSEIVRKRGDLTTDGIPIDSDLNECFQPKEDDVFEGHIQELDVECAM